MIRDQIVDYLMKNRVSTTEVADCLGKAGAVKGVGAINKGHYKVGTVKWICAYDESNWPLHEQVQDIAEEKIIYIETFNCADRAVMGELVSKYLILYRQTRAIVVDGYMRDAAALIRENYPIWCKGFNPIGCFNKKPEKLLDNQIVSERKALYDGAIAVCDDCGVVIIPNEVIKPDFIEKLEFIERQEDIWFERLDRYKENTFEIVCQKNYLKDNI